MMDTAQRRAAPAHMPASAANTHPAPTQNPHDAGDVAGVSDVLTGPTSPEPGAHASDRQLPLFPDTAVSVVSTVELRQLAVKKIRRECWDYDFDWDAFLNADRAWRIAEDVRQKAVNQARKKGLDVRAADIPTDTVLATVQGVITDWTADPQLRPSEAGLSEVQALRGRQGNDERWGKDADARAQRNSQIAALASEGVRDADIARRYGLNRSTIGRILAKANATPPPALPEAVATPPPFPAPELPPAERWPINMFAKLTGIHLDGDEARWLASWGQAYEADRCEDALAALIRISAGAKVDPWAYLQTAIANGADAWAVPAQLLGQALISAGQQSLEYALTAIGGGYVRKPLPYLKMCEANGNHPPDRPQRPVAVAVALARRWAPRLVITDVATAIDAEEYNHRTGNMFSYRRRFGRLPWEPAAAVCCAPLRSPGSDDIKTTELTGKYESSPRSPKGSATKSPPEPSTPEKVEQAADPVILPDSAETRPDQRPPEALQPVERHPRASRTAGATPEIEHGPCRHPLAPMLALALDLAAAVQVDCTAAGCGCQVYSERGPVACACHWPAARAAAVRRALEAHAAA